MYAIIDYHFSIAAWMMISYNLLVAPHIFWYLCQSNRGEIESIQKCGIIKGAGLKWITGIKQIEHTIGSRASLLDSRIPLPNNAGTSCHYICRFEDITRCIYIWSACAHSAIHLHTAPARDATAFDEVDHWLDPNGYNQYITGNTRPARSYHSRNFSIFTHYLSDLFLEAYIDAIASFLLQHEVGCGCI